MRSSTSIISVVACVSLLGVACQSEPSSSNVPAAGASAPPGTAAAGSSVAVPQAGAAHMPDAQTSAAMDSGTAAVLPTGRADAASEAGPVPRTDPDADSSDDAGPLLDAATLADAGKDAGPACADCCADGFARGSMSTKTRKIAALTPSPEGVTVCPNGQVFVALDGSGEVWQVPLDGTPPERWATLGDRRPAGITCDENNRLFVATFSSRSGDTIAINVLLVAGKDQMPVPLPQPENGSALQAVNEVVAARGVGVYASDSTGNSIVLVQERSPGSFATRLVASDVSFANGLAYDATKRKLYAVASGSGEVLVFDVADDGSLEKRSKVPVKPSILFMDGVAVDEAGEVYIADYLGGAVLRASDGRSVAQVTSPASMTFRGGTLLVTDYNVLDQKASGGVYAVDLAVCGAVVAAK